MGSTLHENTSRIRSPLHEIRKKIEKRYQIGERGRDEVDEGPDVVEEVKDEG